MNLIKQVIIGSGQLGLAIMDELVANGQQVKIVSRSGRVNEPLPNSVTVVRGDAYEAASIAKACAGAKTVYFCAQPAYTEWPEKYPRMTASVIEGVAQTGATLVFGDNLYMYGPTDGAPIHEALPMAALGHKGSARRQMAQMLLAAHQQGKLSVVIGRASDFYGPRVKGSALGDRFFAAALAGKTADLFGNPALPHTYTYIRDFARALILLAQDETAHGQVWHVPNAPTTTTQTVVKQVEAEIGQLIKVRTAGRFMVNFLGLFNPMVREFKEMMYEFEEPYIVDDSKFTAVYDLQPTPFTEGIRATVSWYQQHA